MIDIQNLIPTLARKLESLAPRQGLTVWTFKKDRRVTIWKEGDSFAIEEQGFRRERFAGLNQEEVLKRMKKLQKVEFPRSNKLYLTQEEREP